MTLPSFSAEQHHALLQAILPTDYQQLVDESPHHRADWAAHMTPNLAPYSLLGMQLASQHNGNLLSAELYPLLAEAEQTTANWLKKHFPFRHLLFTQSGSYSNLEALWQARERHTGSRNRVYGSRASHYSLKKACQLLGLEWVEFATDTNDQIDINALSQACAQQPPLAIVANFGTTAYGATDPLQDMVELANQFDSWLHIDACWGGAMLMLEPQPELVNADSLSFDPHKGLFVPRPCSVLLSQHQLSESPAQPPSYLQTAPPMRLTGSYGGEVFLPLWLNLMLLGEDWFYTQIRARLEQADILATRLCQLTSWPVFNAGTGIIVFHPEKALSALVADGVVSALPTGDKTAYRAVFASYQTQAEAIITALRPYF